VFFFCVQGKFVFGNAKIKSCWEMVRPWVASLAVSQTQALGAAAGAPTSLGCGTVGAGVDAGDADGGVASWEAVVVGAGAGAGAGAVEVGAPVDDVVNYGPAVAVAAVVDPAAAAAAATDWGVAGGSGSGLDFALEVVLAKA
jgi:hypothetical protein